MFEYPKYAPLAGGAQARRKGNLGGMSAYDARRLGNSASFPPRNFALGIALREPNKLVCQTFQASSATRTGRLAAEATCVSFAVVVCAREQVTESIRASTIISKHARTKKGIHARFATLQS